MTSRAIWKPYAERLERVIVKDQDGLVIGWLFRSWNPTDDSCIVTITYSAPVYVPRPPRVVEGTAVRPESLTPTEVPSQ